jgi:hypothetical protein
MFRTEEMSELKYVKFYSKNKFEKLVHLFGFIIRIYHDTRSSECQKLYILICLDEFLHEAHHMP